MPSPDMTDTLAGYYRDAAQRLKKIVLHPSGRTEGAQAFRQARAAAQLTQVQAELARLKQQVANWTGKSLQASVEKGIAAGDLQAKQSGVVTPNLRGSWDVIDHGALRVLAQDTAADLNKAADSMARTATITLHRMVATGVSNADVNKILAGGILEGKPDQAIRQLRDSLKSVYGEKVTIIDRNSDPMEFDADYYAHLVGVTKMREATVRARHERLQAHGIDLVIIVGRISRNFCTGYLGKIYSLSGEDEKYPSIETLPEGGPPFHPQCSKSTAPYIAALASQVQEQEGQQTDQLTQMSQTKDKTVLQRAYREGHVQQAAAQSQNAQIEDIRARAKAAGYDPPPYGGEAPAKPAPAKRVALLEWLRLGGQP